jgi:hypothetical protein
LSVTIDTAHLVIEAALEYSVYGKLLASESIKWHMVDTNSSDIVGPYRVDR